eukprot:TRINITY_DN719_c0_g1_i4.p1 TRINITY_DN719_c0_g1~~TRINITY_DN719_c0_g1_i4.p1  ORF type:complete len:318 (-),score=110.16 TRINITY_DN719_c0_g1_i4:168-992(-)
MSTKKAKVGEAAEVSQDQLSPAEEAALNKLTQIQDEIEKLNDEATEEILKIEKKYNQKRTPFYGRRSEIIKQIPNFWLKAIQNHDSLADLLSEEDKKVFESLQDIYIEDFTELSSGFKITFTFAQNPYFKNKQLWKEFRYDKDQQLSVIPSPIEWKSPERNLVERATKAFNENSPSSKNKRAHDEADSTFFLWFNPEDQDIEVAEIIKEELWPDPMKWFFGMGNELEEGDDEDEGSYDDAEGEEGDEGENGENGENGEEEEDEGEEGDDENGDA